MPTERVLVEVVTAANMAGIDKAKTGMLGLNASTLLLAAGLGIMVAAGKSAIENTEKQEKAHLSLKQAADVTGKSFESLQSKFDAWAQANRNYIADQYDAESALAAFVRAGNSEKDALRLLNDALDLSVIKHESVSEAESMVEKAMMGNGRALKDLGISTDEYNSIMHNKLLSTEQKHLALMALIETKTKDGRKAQTELQQSQQALNQDWQNLSTKIGPPLLKLMGDLVNQVDAWYQGLDKIGKDDQLWANISSKLVELAGDARALAEYLGLAGTDKTVPKLADRGADRGGSGANTSGAPTSKIKGTASSSGVQQKRWVGTQEIHIHFHGGMFMDHGPTIDAITNAIGRRLRVVTGT